MKKTLAFVFALCLTLGASASNVWQVAGLTVIPKIAGSTPTPGSTIGGITGITAIGGHTIVVDAEVSTWVAGIVAFSAANQPNTKSTWVAQNVIMNLKAASWGAKVKWLLPMLGSNKTAALMPLRDSLVKGQAGGDVTNVTFSEATGMHGNGSSDYIDTLIKPSELGTTNNGGIGYWENGYDATGSSTIRPMGMGFDPGGGTRLYTISLYEAFGGSVEGPWGFDANRSSIPTGGGDGHYYNQRSSATDRRLFVDGAFVDDNTTNDTAGGANGANMYLLAINLSTDLFWKGRCACAYMTDGTLADADVTAFDTLLRTYLFTPTGRPSS